MKTKITKSEAIRIIQRTVKGTMAISLDAVTVPEMRKTNNPFFGKVQKHCTMNGLIGFDYENAVNNQAKREGQAPVREAKPRQWGVLTDDRIFVTHKGAWYLQMKVQSASDPIYKMDDKEIPVLELRPFIPMKVQASSTQEGLEKEIIVRDIKLENVVGMRFCGAEYEIVPDEPNTAPVPIPAPTVAPVEAEPALV